MPFSTHKSKLLYIFFGFFVANAVIAELISVKLYDFGALIGLPEGTYIMALGLLPWPIVFLTTDAINEFYGKKVVRQLSVVTSILLIYVFFIIYIADSLQAFNDTDIVRNEMLQSGKYSLTEIVNLPNKPGVTNTQFHAVFAQSGYLIFGSIIAFLIGQMVDVMLFGFFKRLTKGRFIWLRATGSTIISQFVDSILVIGIGFYLPGFVSAEVYMNMVLTGYLIKLIFAVSLTPLIYLVHFVLKKYFRLESVSYEKA